MRDRLAVVGPRLRGGVSAGTAVTLALALVATVFGVGALGRVTKVYDGNTWLWSSREAQVSRVNAQSARVDLRQPVSDARGHRVRVTQNDRYLILHDHVTGRVTSVDLKSLGFSGRLDVGARGDFRFVLNDKDAFIIDRRTGEVRVVNPATLQPTGPALRLPGPLVGGEFDDEGELWVASPGQGTAIGVRMGDGRPVVAHTVSVAKPGRDLALTVLDKGALAVDRSGRDLVKVAGGKSRKVGSPVALAGATVPDRTNGSLAAVTVPPAKTIVTIADVLGGGEQARATPLGDASAGTVVPFGGKLYAPDRDGRRVRVYTPGGEQAEVISIPGGRGGLELEVHEDSLFINDPGGQKAAVVTRDGDVKVVDKKEGPSTIGGDRSREPSRQPSGDPRPSDSAPPAPPTGSPSRSAPPAPTTSPPASRSIPPIPVPSTTPTDSTAPVGGPPGAPVPVTALAGDKQVRLSWARAHSPDAPVDRYNVTWNGGSRTVPGDRLSTVVTGLTDGRTYRFRVTATNRFGTGPSAQSEEVTPTAARPAAPTGVTAAAQGDNVTVRWNQVSDAEEYVITATNHAGGADYAPRTWGDQPVVNGKVEMRITGMPAGRWSFTVVARNATGGSSGASAPSNTVRVTAPPPPPDTNPPPDTTPNPPPDTGPPPPEKTIGPPDPGDGLEVIPVDPNEGPDPIDTEPGMIPGHPPADGNP
ncbi:fibronectin type III domain-containing protein [Actinomadura alba]|uniref:Fibronectin type III domain-containing protein n=1 Tax=Actinomadura alba TaxID=406431 RepID=A0ABR7LYQ8_9ACTN|nr:fibronectin type III domain-containing protein [Actinomadura alba]MBC6469987.1 fibronectin type III domain-containing protein [Actinomadura alba]